MKYQTSKTHFSTSINRCTPYSSSQSECSRKAGGYYILPPIVSANIQTKDNFSFKYGKIEVRAKLPIGNWIFPSNITFYF